MTLTLLLIALILILTFQCKFSPKGTFTEDFLGKNQSQILRAMACLGVIAHHVTQSITSYGMVNKGPITILASMGILFTSIFFFFSGYGLVTSILAKKDYLDSFLSHRLSAILIPFLTSNVVYTCGRIYINHIPLDNVQILKCIVGLDLINGNGWYIVEIFFLYVIFYVLFKLIKNKDISIILLCIVTIGIITIGYKSGHDYQTDLNHWFKGEWWYNATITFIVGAIYARFKKAIEAFMCKRYYITLPLSTVLFVVSFNIEEKIIKRYGYYQAITISKGITGQLVTFISQSVTCILFIIFITALSLKITFGNRLLRFISSISMELFLIHGFFLEIFEDIRKMPDYLLYILVLISGIVAAVVLHFISSKLISLFIILTNKKKQLHTNERDLIREKKEQHSRKFRNRLLIGFAIAVAISSLGALYYHFVMIPLECKREITSIEKSKVGDVVSLGKYDTDTSLLGKENLHWIVLYKSNNTALLITEKGIDSSQYNDKYGETVWQQSYLCNYINTDLYNMLFSTSEKQYIMPNPETSDMLSLLSVDEANTYFANNESRIIDVTDIAIKNGVYVNAQSKVNNWDLKGYRSSWWWLRGDQSKSLYAPIVTVDGTIETDIQYAHKTKGALRPIVWIQY